MVCKRCGICCQYIVFRVPISRKDVRKAIKQPIICVVVSKAVEKDNERYYKLHNINIVGNKLYIPIHNPKKNKANKLKDGKYELILNCVCGALKDNLCSIWNERPDICNKEKRPKGIEIYVFPECTVIRFKYEGCLGTDCAIGAVDDLIKLLKEDLKIGD